MPRFKSFANRLAAFALFMGICIWRALPAFERGTYATEGGEWLGRMWQTGFWRMIFGARGDYPVLGNMVVIKAADLLTQLLGGHSLAACGPANQHVLACAYVALVFLFVYSVLRTWHGWWRALLVCVVMLLAPDLDGENRVFGEANNVGFFNALGIVFLYYDLWLRDNTSLRRCIVYGLLIVFHLFTSPLAGLIAAAFCCLLALRSLWEWKQHAQPLPRVLWLYALTVPLAIWIILQARPETADPNSDVMTHTAAVVMPRFWKSFIELAVCRQLLYPLTLHFYESFTNGRTLVLLGVVLALVVMWLRAEYRQAAGKPDWRRISLTLLLFAIAFCMSAVTLWSRGWLTQTELPYTKLWPARYYLVQTMLSAGFMVLVLLRAGDLFPRWRRDAVTLVILFAASFAVPQRDAIQTYLSHHDPAVPARHWLPQLTRAYEAHVLSNGGKMPVQPGMLCDVEMYIENHFLQVPASMVADFFASHPAAIEDRCDIATTDPATMKVDTTRREFTLQSKELRVIPRPSGTLVTFDLLLPDAPHFDEKRRKLWLGPLADVSTMQANWYAEVMPRPQAVLHKRSSDFEVLLFKVRLWFDTHLTAEEAQQRLANLPVVVGPTPGEYLARCAVLPALVEAPVSALPDDDSIALAQTPLKEAYRWSWHPKDLAAHNIELGKRGIGMKRNPPFDEAAYTRLNPDVANALADKAITSAKAHYEQWGKKEPRQIAVFSAALDVAKSKLTVDQIAGIRVEITRRKERPERLRCVLHGAGGEQTSLVIVPSEGEGVFETYFLQPGFMKGTFAIQRLEIQFENPQETREFQIEDIFLYQRPS